MEKSGKNSKTLKKQGKYGKVREKFENVKKKTGKIWKSQRKIQKRLKRPEKFENV